MKIKKIILRDSTDSQFDDLITFENEVDYFQILDCINELKKENYEYTNEDVYKELEKLSDFSVEWIGQYEIVKY